MTNQENNSSIDWDAVLRSLDWDDEAHIQSALHQRLRQRAQQYARPVREERIEGDTHTILAFRLGEELYGVSVMVVHGIRPVSRMVRVPGTPRFYRGVVNVRGQIISVMDLRLYFDLAFDDSEAPAELVLVRANQLEIGLLAHHVEGVMTIPHSEIEALDDMRYALGVTRERLVVLDIAQLFQDERLIVGAGDE